MKNIVYYSLCSDETMDGWHPDYVWKHFETEELARDFIQKDTWAESHELYQTTMTFNGEIKFENELIEKIKGIRYTKNLSKK